MYKFESVIFEGKLDWKYLYSSFLLSKKLSSLINELFSLEFDKLIKVFDEVSAEKHSCLHENICSFSS